MAPSLLIVDDDPRFRALARRLLQSRFAVVADAADCAGACEAAARLRPQAALIDVGLPDCDGLELAARLHRRLPALRIALTSSDDLTEMAAAVARVGARGFIPKERLDADALALLLADAPSGA